MIRARFITYPKVKVPAEKGKTKKAIIKVLEKNNC
jgi:hypothetical protein